LVRLYGGLMDGMPVLSVHVPVYVPHDRRVVGMMVGRKDGISIGVVDAGWSLGWRVSQRVDA